MMEMGMGKTKWLPRRVERGETLFHYSLPLESTHFLKV